MTSEPCAPAFPASRCSDLGISYHWLTKVAQGQISSPGVNEIERLHKYLSARFPRAVGEVA